jgi:hypothetical protein
MNAAKGYMEDIFYTVGKKVLMGEKDVIFSTIKTVFNLSQSDLYSGRITLAGLKMLFLGAIFQTSLFQNRWLTWAYPFLHLFLAPAMLAQMDKVILHIISVLNHLGTLYTATTKAYNDGHYQEMRPSDLVMFISMYVPHAICSILGLSRSEKDKAQGVPQGWCEWVADYVSSLLRSANVVFMVYDIITDLYGLTLFGMGHGTGTLANTSKCIKDILQMATLPVHDGGLRELKIHDDTTTCPGPFYTEYNQTCHTGEPDPTIMANFLAKINQIPNVDDQRVAIHDFVDANPGMKKNLLEITPGKANSDFTTLVAAVQRILQADPLNTDAEKHTTAEVESYVREMLDYTSIWERIAAKIMKQTGSTFPGSNPA